MLKRLNSLSRNAVLANSLAIILLRGSATFARLVAMFLIARSISPTEFGSIIYALAIIEMAKVIGDFGIDTLAIREFAVAKSKDSQADFIHTLIGTKFLTSVIAYIGAAGILFFSHTNLQPWVIPITGLMVFTTLFGNIPISYFQAGMQVRRILVPAIVSNGLLVVAIYILMTINPSANLGLITLPIGESLTAIVLWSILRKDLTFKSLSQNIFVSVKIQKLIKRSLPIAITIIVATLYTRLDVIFLSNFTSQADVGFYGVAFRFTEPFQLVAGALAMTAYSRLSTLHANSELESAGRFVKRFGALIIIYSIGVCLCLNVLAPWIVQTFLPQYVQAIPVIRILAFTLLFRTANISITSAIQAYGNYKWITGVAVWNLVLITGLLFLLTPRLGITGAGLSLLIGEMSNLLIQSFLLVKATRDWTLKSLKPMTTHPI